jgi:hypothetical protein
VTRRGVAGILKTLAKEMQPLKIRVVDADRIEFSKARSRHLSIGLTGTYAGVCAAFSRGISLRIFLST